MRLVLLLMATALPLAACDQPDQGTSITFTGNGSDGDAVAAMDGRTGRVNIDVPGFQGSFKLPKVRLTADNFDLNGVHLCPGSTISGFNIDARGKDEDGRVRVSFDSPAPPGMVRDWFQERLAKAGYTLRPEGGGLTGATEEKKPFSLKLDNAGAGHARGTILIG